MSKNDHGLRIRVLGVVFSCLAPLAVSAQTNVSYSDIVGYTTLNVRAKTGSANALSFISLNVHRPVALNGLVQSNSLNGSGQSVITLNNVSNLVTNQFSASTNRHYVRLTSGPNIGLVSEVVGNTASAITVADDLAAVLSNGVTQLEIRPYWTLATAFPGGAGLKAGTSAAIADTVSIVDPLTGAINTYFFSSSASQWRVGTTDSSHVVVPPGAGIMVTRKDPTAVQIRITGEVLTSRVLADIAGGTSSAQRLTFIANPYPLSSVTLGQSGLWVSNNAALGVVGGTSAAAADTVTIYDQTTGAGTTYFYNTTANQWRTGITDSSNVTIPEGAAVLITRKANRGPFEWYIPSPIATPNP